MNDETTAPPNFKLVTVTGCRGHDIFHQIAAAFSGAHHTPGLGTLGANLVVLQIDVRDGLVDLQCLGQGLEAATDQGWRLDFEGPTHKTVDLKSSDQRTFNLTKTCKISLIEPLHEQSRNPQFHSASINLTTLLAMKDE